MIQNTPNVAFCGGKLPNFNRKARKIYVTERYRGVGNFNNPQYAAPKKSVLKDIKMFFYAVRNTILKK